jgi:predicted transcriptional regulator
VILLHNNVMSNNNTGEEENANHFIERRKQYQAARESQLVTSAMIFNSRLKVEYQCSKTEELRDLISKTEQVIIL